MTASADITTPPDVPELGPFVAQCGPSESGRTHYIYFGVGCLIMATLSFIAPYTFLPPKPGDEAVLKTITVLGGCFFVLLAFLMMVLPLLMKPQVIFMFEKGLVERRGTSDRKIPFADISKIKLFEWYEHRFAEPELNVVVTISGQKELRFSSALVGEAQKIIDELTKQCENVEFVPFSA